MFQHGRVIGKVLLASLVLAWSTPGYSKSLAICDDVLDPQTLDPQKEFSEKNHTINQQIYDGLVRLDSDGVIEAALALSWERLDPLKVQFKLREGVSFHNGEPFNASTVKFSIERQLKPETGFPALGFINTIDHVEIVDDYTVNIVTKFPDGLLLNRMAGFFLIVPKQYVLDNGEGKLAEHPNGTGAFMFDKWERGQYLRLRKNPKYWMSGFPKVDTLEFKFIPAEKQVDALLAGAIDILTELPGTRTLSVMENKRTTVVKKDSFYTIASTFFVDKGPLKDVRVRKALNYATDKQELIRYDLLGNGKPIATFSMPGEEGFNPKLQPYPFDLAKAKKLLAEAGYPNGFHLKTLVKNTATRVAGILKAQWAKAGVTLELVVKDEAATIKEMKTSNSDFSFGGCPDPMGHTFFIQGISIFSQSPFSLTNVPEFDQKLIAMVSELDDKKRDQLAQEIDEYIYKEALGIFTYQRIKTYGVNRDVVFTPYVTGMPYLFSVEKK